MIKNAQTLKYLSFSKNSAGSANLCVFAPTLSTYLVWRWELQLIDVQRGHQGDGIKSIFTQRGFCALVAEIVAQFHHPVGLMI